MLSLRVASRLFHRRDPGRPPAIAAALVVAITLYAGIGATARAAWQEASSEHFVLYADEKASTLRRRAERLEHVHEALVGLFRLRDPRPSPSNRLTVFLLDNTYEVNRYFDDRSRSVAGFFIGRGGGSVAFVPRSRGFGALPNTPDQVLLHEYVHFLTWGKQSAVLPPWLSEGYAEYGSSIRFDADDGVSFGQPSERHALRLAGRHDLTLKELLTARSLSDVRADQVDGFYGLGFLLVHYLQAQPDGRAQLDDYVEALGAGAPLIVAATRAFGPLDALAAALAAHRVEPAPSATQPDPDGQGVQVRKLRRGEASALPYRMWLMRGIDDARARELLPALTELSERHEKDDDVFATLAEMHFAARDDERALVEAERVLARSADHFRANLIKMQALHRSVGRAEDRPGAWSLAQKQIVRTHRLERDHPLPLKLFFAGTRAMHMMYGGPAPSPRAFDSMRRALALAPYDDNLRVWVASALKQAGRLEEARITYLPLTTHVHASRHRVDALKAIADIDRELAAEELPQIP